MIKKVLLSALILLCVAANAQTTQTVSTVGTGSWTCPLGVTSVTINCIGGGGGAGYGGGTSRNSGGGGGGGACTHSVVTTTPGTVYNYTVGGGGNAGTTSAGTAGNGTLTAAIFGTTTVTANGGNGGTNGSSGAGGAGGTGQYNGGTGANGNTNKNGGAGGGAAGYASAGSNGTTTNGGAGGGTSLVGGAGGGASTGNNSNGNIGNTYGGGGGSGTGTGSSGNGSSGALFLTYCPTPSITTQPVSYSTTTGSASFSIAATGVSLSYQWQRSKDVGATWANITSTGFDSPNLTYASGSYTTTTLSLTGITSSANDYLYQCVVTSSCNSYAATSGQAVLSYSTCPYIVVEPTSETVVYSGTSTYFHVNVGGPSGLTYQWERSTDNGTTWVNITSASMDVGASYSGYTSATLYLSGVTASVNGYKYKCVITSGTCSVITDGTATLNFSGSQLCGSQYRRAITINKNMVGGGTSLTNFPVLVNVTDATNLKYPGGHIANANGYDIIFTDANGTALNFQTESYTAASGTYVGWVKIPTLSATANTTIYMYYGDPSFTTDQSLPTTWDTSFVAVYHLNDYTDATVNNLDGGGNSTSINTAKILNGATGFGYIAATGGASSVYNNVTQNITVSGWVNIGSTGLDQKIAGSEDNTNGGWKMGVYSDNTLEFECRTNANAPFLNRGYGTPTTLSSGTWYYVVGQYSQGAGGYINTYVGGTANFTSGTPDRGSSYATTNVMGTSTGTLSIGCEAFAPTTANWSGTLDEIRISKVIRSVGWLQTEYNNQNNPATYVTLGSEGTTDTWTGTGNWSVTGNWSGGLPTATSDIIVSSGTVTVNSNIQINSLTIKSGAVVTIGSGNTLSVSSYVMTCGIVNGAGSLTMNSTTSTNQNVSGTGTYSLTNFVINNTASTPTVTLQAPVSVSGAITLTSGLLNTDATNIVTMQNGSTAPALTSTATSYVNGPMRYQLASTTGTTINFPIGSGADCRPVALTLLHSTTSLYNYTAQLFNGNPWTAMGSTLSSQMPSTVDTISAIHYWTINRTDASGTSQSTLDLSGNQTIKLFFGTNDQVYQGSSLTIVKNTSAAPSSWIDIGGTSSLGNFSSAQTGSVSSTSSPAAFNSFSSFTLGSKNTGWNPLPIELLSFSALPDDDKVDITWETITETDNAYFTIEKSKDGKNFTKLIDVPGAGNSTSYKNYAETDYQPYLGTSYYRLKQTDKNGAFKYFNMVPVNFTSKNNIVVFPNPLYNNTGPSLNIKVTGYQNQEVVVVLRDIQGREFLSKVLLTEDNNQLFVIDETKSLMPGTYIVTASSNDKIYNYKLIVK